MDVNVRKIISTKFPCLYYRLCNIKFALWRIKAHILAGFKRSRLSNGDIYWINPAKIKYLRIDAISRRINFRKKILGGNWDRNVLLIRELDFYESLKKSLVEKIYSSSKSNYLTSKEKINGIINKSNQNLLQDFKEIQETVFSSPIIRENNKPQYRFSNPSKTASGELLVSIDRKGALLLESGLESYALYELLELEKVPVKVLFRHREWDKFRCEVRCIAHKRGGKLYQPIDHLDFMYFPVDHDDFRYKLIAENLPFKSGTLLDIGAYWGYFVGKFEDIGFDCYAIDHSEQECYFMNKIKCALNKNFTVIHQDVLDFFEKCEYDVILALNIFHHFLKTKKTFDKLKYLLNRLKAEVMFFEPHSPEEEHMKDAYKNFSNEDFIEFIVKNSSFKKSDFLGHCPDGRPIYRLSV